jgi:hypothetical protein
LRRLPQVGALLLAAGAVASGCGGDGGNASRVPDDVSAKNQVAAYLAAFNRGDGRSACALLTPEARAGVPSLADQIQAPDCEGAIRELARIGAHLRSPRISVEVGGDRAIAKVVSRRPPYQSDVLLRKEGGAWRIAFPPALLERYRTPPGIPSELGRRGRKRSG